MRLCQPTSWLAGRNTVQEWTGTREKRAGQDKTGGLQRQKRALEGQEERASFGQKQNWRRRRGQASQQRRLDRTRSFLGSQRRREKGPYFFVPAKSSERLYNRGRVGWGNRALKTTQGLLNMGPRTTGRWQATRAWVGKGEPAATACGASC